MANLSRFPQHAELDLAAHAGRVPVELFGRTRLPAIGERPYPVLLAPHAFLWLALEPPGSAVTGTPAARPVLAVGRDWGELFADPVRAELEGLLPAFLAAQPWFGGKARTLLGVRIAEVVVNHRARRAGTSKYGLSRTIRVVLDLVTVKFLLSYSTRPLQIFGLLGLVAGVLGGAITAYLGWVRLVLHQPIADRPLTELASMSRQVIATLLSRCGVPDSGVALTQFFADGEDYTPRTSAVSLQDRPPMITLRPRG